MKESTSSLFSKTQFSLLWGLVVATFLAKLLFIFHPFNPLPIDDELYYLLFSENLRLLYPDHPPMVAIFLATALLAFDSFSPGTFESHLPKSLPLIHISSSIYMLLTCAFVYYFVAHVWQNKLYATLLILCLFLVTYFWGISFLTTPDTALNFFSFPALLFFAHAFLINPKKLGTWLLAGLFLAAAFLSKILAIQLGLSIAAFAVISPNRKLYLKNYRFYIAFLPSLIAGIVILYVDSLDNFSMTRFLFYRNSIKTNFNESSNVFINQFIYYTPVFFALILILPAVTIFKNLSKKSRKRPAETSFISPLSNKFFDEALFFFAVVSFFCTTYIVYKIFTIHSLTWWAGFTAAPNFLFICLWITNKTKKKPQSKKKISNLVFANLIFSGIFCILAVFHSLYGILDPNYSKNYVSNNHMEHNHFPTYNSIINNLAKKIKNSTKTYPEENGAWFYKYHPIKQDFKKFYKNNMDENIPILTTYYGTAVVIRYYVKPKITPIALTTYTSPLKIRHLRKENFYNSLFNFSDLKGQSFYLMDFENLKYKNSNSADRNVILTSKYGCTLKKTFYAYRIGKPIYTHDLFFCKNGVQ